MKEERGYKKRTVPRLKAELKNRKNFYKRRNSNGKTERRRLRKI
jgi:hypothetical protein